MNGQPIHTLLQMTNMMNNDQNKEIKKKGSLLNGLKIFKNNLDSFWGARSMHNFEDIIKRVIISGG